MNVELINGSENPEEMICRAARNDYREDGIIGNSFGEVMVGIDPADEHLSSQGLRTDVTVAESGNPAVTTAAKYTLIDHLIDNGHWGPMEHPQAVVAIEGITRVVTHQLVRHRQFSYDQQSFRYVELDDVSRENIGEKFQLPNFRGEDFEVDREGVHEIDRPREVNSLYRDAYSDAVAYYEDLRDKGVPKEQARKVLPMGIKTNIVMSGNARAWMHILNVRTKANVQGETRRCAEAIFEELKEWAPYVFEKYDEDVLPMSLNP